jgi:signal transduction histidine kinase
LSNIAKHAAAGRVEIKLRNEAGVVELLIRDDGCGFDPAHIPAGRHGLSMMRERAKAVGAALSVTSRPGQGTEIFIRWPETPLQEAL